MSKPPIKFDRIDKTEIPRRLPVAKPPSERRGSQWDQALDFLVRYGKTDAVKIVARDKGKRARYESTLRVRAINREIPIEVRADDTAVYAWLSDRFGRSDSPQPEPLTLPSE
jgi:hypothetical protein